MKYFLFEDNKLVLNKESILLVKEFADLWDTSRNRIEGDNRGYERKRAYKEFTYMFLMFDWESPYKAYTEKEKHEAASYDADMVQKDLDNELFKLACIKYQELQETRMLKLLNSMHKTIDELQLFFSTVDLQERDMEGRPIFNAKQVSDTIAGIGRTVVSLQTVESIVKQEKEGEESKLRGDKKAGLFD